MSNDMTSVIQSSRPLLAFRVVQWATLAALAWKIGGFVAMVNCYVAIPLNQDFFPWVFRSSYVLTFAYLIGCISLACAALTQSARRRIIATIVSLACMSILCIHQGSHNDMTFATAWWTSLWSVWLATRLPIDAPESLIRRAAFVSRCIISMILLGGAVGKWTSEYWSGQVLYEIYFEQRDFWFFNLIRSRFSLAGLRTVATWYSRNVIIVETLGGLGIWLLPPWWAAAVSIGVLASIATFSNFNLYSVLLSLMGLAAAGFFVALRVRTPD